MDSQKLIEFKGELEAIATYGNETITQKEFKDFFADFRQSAIKYGILPFEIKVICCYRIKNSRISTRICSEN